MAQRLAPVFALWFVTVVAACAHVPSAEERARADVHYEVGIAAFGRQDYRQALRELLRAVALDEGQAKIHHALGLVYHALGRTTESLNHYDRAVAIDPKNSEIHNNRGVLLIDAGRYEEAIASFELALSDILYATPSSAEGNMGYAYFLAGDAETGKRHLRNAVATNPKFCRGYYWLAEISVATRDPTETIAQVLSFERMCLADPAIASIVPKPLSQQMFGWGAAAYRERGDLARANEWFARCIDELGDPELNARCAQAQVHPSL